MSLSVLPTYFPDLTERQQDQFARLLPLYKEWNAKINVISRKDINQLYERHILHSLSIARFVQFTAGSEIMDVGTGGGFPGLPLAIFFPECRFYCVDSIGKKITVVREIAHAIGLKNLTVEHQRMEKVAGSFDFVVSRAVAPARQLYQWTHQKIKTEQKNELDNGLILLKGGELQAELQALKRRYVLKNLAEEFTEDFFETKQIVYVPVH